MKTTDTVVKINDLLEEERPREKLMAHGARNLTNAELLAILINSGTPKASALDLARELLNISNNNLQDLQRMNWSDLSQVSGIGPKKAITLTAAFELGKRRRQEEAKKINRITCSRDAYVQFDALLEDNRQEEFWVLFLNRNNGIIAKNRVSEGGVSATVVDPKVVFNLALRVMASAIILCHNHPSGNLQPSTQDVAITKKLKEAGYFLEIYVQDHIIIANNQYFSFADEGIL